MAKYKVTLLLNETIKRHFTYNTQKEIVNHAEAIFNSSICRSVLATDSTGRIWFDQKKLNKKIRLFVTFPDGTIGNRYTKNQYKFVVAAKFDGSEIKLNPNWIGWCALKWTTQQKYAEAFKTQLESQRWKSIQEIKIIPVD